MEYSNLKRYLTLIWQRLTQPLPKWVHYLLFLLAFILFLHYENPALWDALASASSAIWEFLINAPSAIWEFLLNIPSANLDLPWYVLVLGFIAYIIFMLLLIDYLKVKIYQAYESNACHVKFIRRFISLEKLPEEPVATWLFLFLFTSFLILCISLFFEPGTFWSAFWDGLINLPSIIWGWLLNILSPIWDLPWYVLLGGFIAWFVIGNILFLIFDLQGTIFKCEVCHTELIRRFLYFIETKRASYSPLDLKRKGDRHSRRALSRINKRRNKFSDEDWKRIFNRRERLLIHLKLIERRKPKRFGVIKYVYEKNLNHYDKLEHVLFLLSIGVINIFVYSFMQPTCPKCGEKKWLEGSYGYEGGSAINWRKLAKEKENDKQQKP